MVKLSSTHYSAHTRYSPWYH